MSRRRGTTIGLVAVAAVVVAALVTVRLTRDPAADAAATTEVVDEPFDPSAFPRGAVIDNRFVPLVPGTQQVLEGTASRAPGVLPHRVVLTVTDLTKVIDGVTVRVVHDVDLNAGELEESELAFEAQDRTGRVWNMGEYPEEYRRGKLKGAPSTWIPGQGAKAGVLMRKEPKVGTSGYRQGFSAEIEFGDAAKVVKQGQHVCVAAGCFDDVLVVDEWNTFEPDAHQLKYYAPGTGNILIEPVDDPDNERLELVSVVRLTPDQMVKENDDALALDRRAFEGIAMYRATSPARAG